MNCAFMNCAHINNNIRDIADFPILIYRILCQTSYCAPFFFLLLFFFWFHYFDLILCHIRQWNELGWVIIVRAVCVFLIYFISSWFNHFNRYVYWINRWMKLFRLYIIIMLEAVIYILVFCLFIFIPKYFKMRNNGNSERYVCSIFLRVLTKPKLLLVWLLVHLWSHKIGMN